MNIITLRPGIQTCLLGDRNFHLHHLCDHPVADGVACGKGSTGTRYPFPLEKLLYD